MASQSLSLYIDLSPDAQADLEIFAQAAISFADLIKEIAAFVDPFSEVTVEVVDVSEGSLSLNALIRFFRSKTGKVTALSVAVTVGVWLGNKVLDLAWEKLSDYALEQAQGEKGFNETQKEEIAEIVARTMGARVGQKQSQRLYRTLAKDKAVKGVGVTRNPRTRPEVVVPHTEFEVRGGLTDAKQVSERRVRIERRTAVVIKPVLVEGKRRWRFRSAQEGEFGASIRDTHFLDSLLSGDIPIQMRSNLELTLEIEVIEEYQNGFWVPIERNILKIIGVLRQQNDDQSSFDFDDD